MKIAIKNINCILFFSICFTIQVAGQKQPPYIEYLSTKDGLSSNAIATTFRDTKGYLWIGTNDGLNRFNGIDFKVFYHDSKNLNSVKENYINKIFEDSYGKIWLVTHNNRLCVYNPSGPSGKEFTSFARSAEFPNAPEYDRVGYVFEDAGKKVWVTTHDGALIQFDKNSSNFLKGVYLYNNNGNVIEGMPLHFSDDAKRLYFFNESIGVYAADLKNKKPEILSDSILKTFLSENNVTATFVQLTKDEKNNPSHNLWCATTDGKFISFNLESNRASEIFEVPDSKDELIEAIGVDYNGNVWISGNKGGAHVYHPTTNHFEYYLLPFKSPYDAMPAVLKRYYLDSENIFWMISRSGLYKMDPLLNQFENFSVRQPGITFKQQLNVSAFYKPSPDSLLIGELNGIHIYNESKNTLTFKPVIHDRKEIHVSEFFKDARNNTILNTIGLQNIDLKNWKFPEFEYKGDTNDISRFKGSAFHSMMIDTIKNKEVWWLPGWGTNGLFRYYPESKLVERFEPKRPDGSTFTTHSLRGIAKDKRGNIWTGSMEFGACCITDPMKLNYTIYTHIEGDSTSLPGNRIYDICTDNHGDVWFIIPVYGIAQLYYDKNNKPCFKGYSAAQGLHNFYLYDALVDDKNNIWIASDAGIDKFDVDKKKFTHYSSADGILNPQFATGSAKMDDGYFYFSSWQTFIRFKPATLIDNPKIPKVNIVQLKVMDRDSSELIHSASINLPYNKNFITIELETVSMTNAGSNKIRYMLTGIDNNWNYDNAKSKITYSALQPGSYVFKYNACNKTGNWNNTDRQIAFVISPPFYNTWWFYSICIFTAVFMLYAFYRYRIALVRKEEKLTLSVMVKTQEEERRRMARDLHDDVGAQLSTVKLFISSLEKEKQSDEAEKLRKNSIEIINSSINDIREILVNLSPKSLDEHGYVAATEELVNKINQSNFVKFDLRIHGIKERLERTIEVALFRITQELINNTIKHAEASEIFLEIILRDEKIFLLYEDNGKGFDSEKTNHGYGLKNIQTRAALMNGIVHFDSTTGKGTRVQIEIPYSDSLLNSNSKKS